MITINFVHHWYGGIFPSIFSKPGPWNVGLNDLKTLMANYDVMLVTRGKDLGLYLADKGSSFKTR